MGQVSLLSAKRLIYTGAVLLSHSARGVSRRQDRHPRLEAVDFVRPLRRANLMQGADFDGDMAGADDARLRDSIAELLFQKSDIAWQVADRRSPEMALNS